MKTMIKPLAINAIILVLFVAGLVTAQAVPMMAGFCAAPLAIFWLGYATHSAGLRLTLSVQTSETHAPIKRDILPDADQINNRRDGAKRRALQALK